MRSQAVLVESCEDVIDDRVLGLGEQERLKEGRLRNATEADAPERTNHGAAAAGRYPNRRWFPPPL